MNLASRLEGLCRFYDVDILIGENTVDQLEKRERWILIPVDRVRVKGKVEPILVYWLAGEATDPSYEDWRSFTARCKTPIGLKTGAPVWRC